MNQFLFQKLIKAFPKQPDGQMKKESVVIIKNNARCYVLISYSQIQKEKIVGDEEVDEIAKGVLSKHMRNFRELVK